MKLKSILAAVIVAAFATACARGDEPGPKQTIGTLGGAVLGGLLGSEIGSGSGRLWATGAGAVLGALAGSEVGKSLDRADQLYMSQTTQAALEHTKTGTTSTWNNPDSGHSGTVTPIDTYQRSDGIYCREFQQTVIVAGEEQQAYGTACRQPDGTWKVQ
ncbi:RT0821/Lpp0805 family surface protein [Ferruginivarius sediminum]|uniref:Glycine zipper 2TM domain-containing protein n=1 Tax=Ferruginivarius sediminum TaxID=2661937 RepID=A0A369TB91_9PROT|nr:RT0821/Lpp0805 family surface protein [Ferruginivarius sediminum]RDD62548.1 glycine zipper 2TM domain-containing protein [Ferruginivarius sediminum]